MRLFLLIIISSNIALAQQSNWANAGVVQMNGAIRTIVVDSINDVMYIAGNTYDMGNVDSTRILRYHNGVWDTLPGCFSDIIMAMTIYNNELYVGGSFDHVNSVETGRLVKWSESSWQKVGEGLWSELGGGAWGSIRNLKIIEDTLYATGVFNRSGTTSEVNSIAKWDGSAWRNIYNIPVFSIDSSFVVFDIDKYNNEYYVCGNFNADTIEDIVKYNGEKWVSTGDEIKGWDSQLTSLAIYKDELYLGGIVNNGGGTNGHVTLAKYNGQKWSEVGHSPDGYNSYSLIRDIKIFNDKLYACGDFSYAGGILINSIATWDGSKWCGFGGVFKYGIVTFDFYHDTLFVSCADSVDNIEVNGLAKWIGGDYVDTCSQPYSVPEISDNTGVAIFPNPAHSHIKITSNNGEQLKHAKIYSLTGKMVLRKELNAANAEIDVSGLADGLYVVKVQTTSEVLYKKIIIQK